MDCTSRFSHDVALYLNNNTLFNADNLYAPAQESLVLTA